MLRIVGSFILLMALLLPLNSMAQDTIVFDDSGKLLNRSIADQFTIYSSEKFYSLDDLGTKDSWSKMTKRKISNSVENLDFTDENHYIHMILINKTDRAQRYYLETARPITNRVDFLPFYNDTRSWDELRRSGDGIPFEEKSVPTNRSIVPIFLPADDTVRCFLSLGSDGESLTVPMIFHEKASYERLQSQRQFKAGLFYGIFIFVIIIYFTFFLLLKDRLFLLYTIYVFFSGLLQFALDGYVHEYIFTSGGYWTHHSVIFIAGTTVFFALSYATRYLQLVGIRLRISRIFLLLVALTTLASLIPGPIFVACYPLINLFSLLSLVFLLVVGIQIRRSNKRVNPLFMTGLFLLLAGGMYFILGNIGVIDAPEYTQYGLKIGTLLEIICLSILMAGKYKQMQEEKEEVQKQLLRELESIHRLTEETNVRLEREVAERTKEIEQKRAELAEKNSDLMDSINYAERIQSALLPPQQQIQNWLSKFFIFFQPKEVLSGDFYWMEEVQTSEETPQNLLVYATADCTGHGVPGAFVSVVCNNLLKLSKTQNDVNSPGEALDFINREINDLLNPTYKTQEIRDGMDVAMCAINFDRMEMQYAGAKMPLYLLRDGEIIVYKGDRHAIGNDTKSADFCFTTLTIPLKSGDRLYTFSDGIPDQFGGPNDKKFLKKRLNALLIEHSNLSMAAQKNAIEKAINDWMKDSPQIDDMLLIGIQIP